MYSIYLCLFGKSERMLSVKEWGVCVCRVELR